MLSKRKLHHDCGHPLSTMEKVPWKMCWQQPNYSVAVLAKRPDDQVRLVKTMNPGESSVVTGLSAISLRFKREKCTCGGYLSMKPRNAQLDTSGSKVNMLETLMPVTCRSFCRNTGYSFLDGFAHTHTHCGRHQEFLIFIHETWRKTPLEL